MEGIENNKMRGKAKNVYMPIWAWDFIKEIQKEQTCYPPKGQGKIIEDLLLREKARREKLQKSADKQPAA